MTKSELGAQLKKMYSTAPYGESTTFIHLFGIMYADEIRKGDFTATEIVAAAGIHSSYNAEVSKGIRLSRYVSLRK